jgi:hypothetical protein
MTQISNVPRETAVQVFGTVWLAEDFGGDRLVEHLGTYKPSLHFGEAFPDLETARAARPTHRPVYLGDRIALPNVTPVPMPRTAQSGNIVPREIFVVEFDNILERGLRVATAQIEKVEFDTAPAHLVGKVDFVAGAVVAGPHGKYRVLIQYDENLGLNIVENPMVLSERGNYVASGQVMAFFRAEDAAAEADRFAKGLVEAADWRSRTDALAA